jgi:hypothetical protein
VPVLLALYGALVTSIVTAAAGTAKVAISKPNGSVAINNWPRIQDVRLIVHVSNRYGSLRDPGNAQELSGRRALQLNDSATPARRRIFQRKKGSNRVSTQDALRPGIATWSSAHFAATSSSVHCHVS